MNLLAYLLNQSDPVPWKTISEQVEGYGAPLSVGEAAAPYGTGKPDKAADKRFARDRKLLEAAGIRVHYSSPGKGHGGGYYVSHGDCFMPGLGLTPQERALLGRVLAIAATDRDMPLAEPLYSAVQKLLFEDCDAEPERTGEVVCFLKNKTDSTVNENFRILHDAIDARRNVSFHYHSISRDAVDKREVAPYALGAYSGHWYLVGRCLAKKAVRVFRLDRILTTVKILNADAKGPAYAVPEDFDIRRYLGMRSWAMRDGDAETTGPTRVTTRFDAGIGRYAAELLGEDAECELRESGECVATLNATRPESFFRWLLKFGPKAKIVAPTEVQRNFADYVRTVMNQYAEETADAASR